MPVKKKVKSKKSRGKTNNRDLAKREYTEEEKARLANYRERANKKPIKFETLGSDSGETDQRQLFLPSGDN